MATFGCECEACADERKEAEAHDENDDILTYDMIDGSLVMRVMILSGLRDEKGEPDLMLDETFNPLVGEPLLRKIIVHAREGTLYGFLAQRSMHGKVRAGDLVPFTEVVAALGGSVSDLPEDESEPGEQGEGEGKLH